MTYICLSSNILQFHLFADDTSIFLAHENLKYIENTLNTELRNVSNWLNANKLTLNASKSNYIIFHPAQKKSHAINLKINKKTLTEKQNSKYLGVILDNHISWRNHINHVNLKLSKSIGIISKLRDTMSQTIFSELFFMLFFSLTLTTV